MKHEEFKNELVKQRNDFMFWLNDQKNINWDYDEKTNTITVTHKPRSGGEMNGEETNNHRST